MGIDAVLGHEGPKGLLTSAIGKDRLAHAYLFHGPEGVGKRTFGLAVASALFCRTRPGRGCDRCPPCRKVSHETHPDVIVHRCEPGQESVGVDQVRAIVAEASLRPFEESRKVFLLDQVHLMTESAANALLKTLEEPPSGSMLLLVADRIAGLPDTVVSRCQPVAFHGIATDQVRRWLVEREGVDEGEAGWLASFCEGSIGRALRYVREEWGPVRDELVGRLASPRGWGLPAAEYLSDTCRRGGSSAAEARARVRTALDLLTLLVRDVIVLASAGDPSDLYNRDREEQLRTIANAIGFERATRVLQTLTDAIEWTERNAHVDLLLETMSLRLRRILAGAGEIR